MINRFCALLLLCLSGLSPAFAGMPPYKNLFISPSGNDAATGINANLSDAVNGPVQNYPRVQTLVAAAVSTLPANYGGIIVNQLGGTYNTGSASPGISFSGGGGPNPSQPVIYQGYPNGSAITTINGSAQQQIQVTGASNLILRDFAVTGSTGGSGSAIFVVGVSNNVRIDRSSGVAFVTETSTVTNSGATNSTFIIALIGYQGGNATTLTASNDYAINNTFGGTTSYCVDQQGVGAIVVNNLITNCGDSGIRYSGILGFSGYNEISNVCNVDGDCGAFYNGRSWVLRGNQIEFNYIHDLPLANNAGIYADDELSGVFAYGNICLNSVQAHARCFLNGGGNQNIFQNNVVSNFTTASAYDDRGAPCGFFFPNISQLYTSLTTEPYTSPIWAANFPALPGINTVTPPANIAQHDLWLNNVSNGVVVDENDYCDQTNLQYISLTNEWASTSPSKTNPSAWTGASPAVTQLGFSSLPAGFTALPLTSIGLNPSVPPLIWSVIYYPQLSLLP